jgi:hypothetical protein
MSTSEFRDTQVNEKRWKVLKTESNKRKMKSMGGKYHNGEKTKRG